MNREVWTAAETLHLLPVALVLPGDAAQLSHEGQRALLRHKLGAYGSAGAASLEVYMLAEQRPSNDRRYYKLPIDAALGDVLVGKVVLEFPTLHVVIPGRADAAQFPLMDEAAARATEVGSVSTNSL